MTQNQEPITWEEYRTLAEAAHEHSLRSGFTVYLLGYTGMRRNEAAHFTRDWFDPDLPAVWIPKTQNGWSPKSEYRARDIPLSPFAANNIEKYLDELSDEENVFNVAPQTINRRINRVTQDLDLGHITPCKIRHMYANKLLSQGVSKPIMAAVLGLRTNYFTLTSENVYLHSNDWNWPAEDKLDLW